MLSGSSHKRLPEVKIVHRTLLVSHVDVEREEIDGSESPTTQDLEQRRQAIALLHVDKRVGRSHFVDLDCCHR